MTDFKTIASSLEERGFCVVPEFLSREEIDFLVEEFDACPDYSPPAKTGSPPFECWCLSLARFAL